MRVTQARLSAYRADVEAYGEAARSYVGQYLRALMDEFPGMPVADLRDEAIGAVNDSLNAFGDQAAALSLELLEEVVSERGIDPVAEVEGVVPPEMVDGAVRYRARRIIEGDREGFVRDVADLSRYYVHRCAIENMERNCERNDLRYARVPSGRETCGFCFMLSSRGFVYRSEETAGSTHAYHENCDCVIVPGFKDDDRELGPQIEGYDPEGMRRRWHKCQDAAGSSSELRERWESMTGAQRSRYKGNTDGERYRRFANAQAIREAEARDFRWLNTGEPPRPRHESERARNELNRFERMTRDVLEENGFSQYVLERSNEHGVKTPDVLLGSHETRADYKTPRGTGFNSIDQLMRDAGKKADIAVIHLIDGESTMGLEDAIAHFKRCGERRGISEAIFIDYDGSLKRVRIEASHTKGRKGSE